MTGLSQKPLALFIVGGLGLGNSTRCEAVITSLVASGWSVDVATARKGLLFFADNKKVRRLYTLRQSHYVGSSNAVSIFNVFLAALTFVAAGLANFFAIFRILWANRPDVIVVDSNYSLATALFSDVPLVSLNNSSEVIAYYRRARRQISGHLAQFIVEVGDWLYQKLIPDIVIVPCGAPTFATPETKFKLVEPIVRPQFHELAPRRRQIEKIAIIYSGSGIGAVLHHGSALNNFDVVVIGASGEDTSQMKFVGDTFDTSLWAASCDLIITSGGFSSISEALALKKPMIVVPIERHAEQNANAQMIEKLGVGVSCDVASLGASVRFMSQRYGQFARAYDNFTLACNGAIQARQQIVAAAFQHRNAH